MILETSPVMFATATLQPDVFYKCTLKTQQTYENSLFPVEIGRKTVKKEIKVTNRQTTSQRRGKADIDAIEDSSSHLRITPSRPSEAKSRCEAFGLQLPEIYAKRLMN